MPSEDLLSLLEKTEDPESKRKIIEGLFAERQAETERALLQDTWTHESQEKQRDQTFELKKLIEVARVEGRSTRKNFWFGATFIGLVSTVLVLVIGEAFGVVKVSTEHSQRLQVDTREFERNMISQAIEENDDDSRIDALRLLILADLLPGLTEGDLATYEKSLAGRAVPSLGSSTSTGTASPIDNELSRLLGVPGDEIRSQLVRLPSPFKMRLSWNTSQAITKAFLI